jgi:zinc transport system permease protein
MNDFSFSIFLEPFAYRSVIVGVLVAVCAALLGVTLVLKRFSMIGDGLSHVAFGSLAIASALNLAPLEFSIPVMVAVAFFLLRLSENSQLAGDSAIAIISCSALSLGVVVVSFSRGGNFDLNSYLFGNIMAVGWGELWISTVLTVILIAVAILFHNSIFAVSFDESFAQAIGIKVKLFKLVAALLTAITIVIGMNIMGTMLISSLIIFPTLTVTRLSKSFRGTVFGAVIIAVFTVSIGILLAFMFSLPLGATMVLCNLLLFLIFTLIGKIRAA